MPGVKGKTNNPHGRPPAGHAFIDELTKALKKVEQKKGQSLIEYAVERAYKNDVVLCALLKKILPDQIDLGNKGDRPFLLKML